MTELRKPSTQAGPIHVTYTRGLMAAPALVLVSDLVCDGCKWTERCRRDGFCWDSEKRKIAEERENRTKSLRK